MTLALVLAGPDAKASAAYSVNDSVMSMPSFLSLEDNVAPELGMMTAVDLNSKGLEASRLACVEGESGTPAGIARKSTSALKHHHSERKGTTYGRQCNLLPALPGGPFMHEW